MEVSQAKTPKRPRSLSPDLAGLSQEAALGQRASSLKIHPIDLVQNV